MSYDRGGRGRDGMSIPEIFKTLTGGAKLNSVGGVFCILLLIAAGSIVVHFGKGIQGRNCSASMSWFNEDSYARHGGCWIYRFLNLFPSNFDSDPGIYQQTQPSFSSGFGQPPAAPGTLAAPPAAQQQSLSDAEREAITDQVLQDLQGQPANPGVTPPQPAP